MGLDTTYPTWFEAIWKSYPTKLFPNRHRKSKAYEVAVKLANEDDWQKDDVNELIRRIEEQKKMNINWQSNSKIGPKGLQSWLEVKGYQDGYLAKQKDKYERANEEYERRLRIVE